MSAPWPVNLSSEEGLVDVIVPVKNREDSIERCVRSILDQDYGKLRVYVVDDGSSDGTVGVLSGIDDPRLSVKVTPGGLGGGGARNLGVSLGEGEWLTFLDSDDYALPGWISGLAAASEPGIGIVFCSIECREAAGPAGTARVEMPRSLAPGYPGVTGLFLAGTFLIKRELFERIGAYDTSLPAAQHTDLLMRAFEQCAGEGMRTAHVDRVGTVSIRGRADGIRHDHEAVLAATVRMIEKHQMALARDPRSLSSYWALASHAAEQVGQYGTARKYALNSVRVSPLEHRRWLRLAKSLASTFRTQIGLGRS